MNVAAESPGPSEAARSERKALRSRLIAERDAFVASGKLDAASAALSDHLRAALVPLEPACLGLYWPLRSEFNAAAALAADPAFDKVIARAAICTARGARDGVQALGRWRADALLDECGIGSSDGAAVHPDVVVVPCVGFTAAGHRLGYGAGYYDRWLAAHPHVVAVGVAWSMGEIDLATFAARAHDVPLAFVVTERGVA